MSKTFLDQMDSATQYTDPEFEKKMDQFLYSKEAEIKSLNDLEEQRTTPIPALFNQFYKFVQNPSVVSVETYKRMVDTDDTIGSGVDFLVTCLAARIGAYTHEDAEISEWVNGWLEKLDGGWEETLKEILSATWVGFSVSEVVYRDEEEMGWVPRKVVTLPPGTILFEAERTGELTKDGILQYQRNYNPFLMGRGMGYYGSPVGMGVGLNGGYAGEPDSLAKYGDIPFPLRSANTFSYLSVRVPVAKCIHYAFNAQGKFGNPYGRSLLRRIYKWWVMKDAFSRMMTVALNRKGTPLTVVWADPNTTLEDPSAIQGGENPKGMKRKGIRADKAAQQAFKDVHNDSVIFLPGKKGEIFDVETISQQSNVTDFLSAIQQCDKAILRGLLLPALIFSSGDGSGSYALGQEHAKTFDKICDSINSSATTALITQFIARAIRLNFPESKWKKDGFGKFGKRELSPDEIQKEMETIEKAVNVGAVDMNDLEDLNKVRDKIGFEARDEIIEKPMVDEFGNPMSDEDDESDMDQKNSDTDNKKDDKQKPKPIKKEGKENG